MAVSTVSCDPVVVGRFAPSPSGRLHIGNIFSFLITYLQAMQAGGACVLRIEDIDPDRSKQCHIDQILRDLTWFGFEWEGEVLYQSKRTDMYAAALEELRQRDLVYPCFCSRRDLHVASAVHFGDEFVYPNTCRYLSREDRTAKRKDKIPALRLKVDGLPRVFDDAFQGHKSYDLLSCSGDFVLRRSDGVFAYQLAVVVDDAASGVTSVVRGMDLITSTPRQIYLQELLGYPHPTYAHVPVIVDAEGRKLSKRIHDASLEFLIDEAHHSPEEVIGMVAYRTGLIDVDEACSLDELVRGADLSRLRGVEHIAWETD